VSTDEQRLVLVRHAKSAHPPGTDDHERPLDDLGRTEAALVGQRLAEAGWRPDHVLCSDAVRALSTWRRMAPAFGTGFPVDVTRRLYHAGPDALDEVVREADLRDARCVFAVGHNPGWEEAALELTGVAVGVATATAVMMRRKVAAPWTSPLGVRAWEIVEVLRGR
jgi:phosphohistidine phosphatase